MAYLIIDNREQYIKEYFTSTSTDINIRYENLELGDIIIEDETNQIKIILERKTIPDLVASIKDGRYKNQKRSLLDNFNRRNIIYIIEGTLVYNDTVINGLSNNIIISAVLNTLLRDDIKIIQTKNTQETIDLVKNIYNRIKDTPSKYVIHSSSASEPTFIKKHKVFTKRDCHIAQLCQVPGISQKTAECLLDNFHDLRNLIDDVKNGGNQLNNIKIGNKKMSSRVISNLMEYV